MTSKAKFPTFLLLWAILSLALVTGALIPSFGKYLLKPRTGCLGDLYKFTYITHFKLPQPCDSADATPDVINDDNARIVTLGDSFFNKDSTGTLFPRLLSRLLNQPILNLSPPEAPRSLLDVVGQLKKTDKARKLVVGIVERNTTYRLKYPPSAEEIETPALNFLRSHPDTERLDYIFFHNWLFDGIFEFGQTLKFSLSGVLPSEHLYEKYNLEPPLLFYRADVAFSQTNKFEGTIDRVTRNILRFRDSLKVDFNIDLVLLVIPNKYSIYGNLVDPSFQYDGYVSKLTEKLRSSGVTAPDLYNLFKQHSDQTLYYPTDTHWNEEGKTLAINAVLDAL